MRNLTIIILFFCASLNAQEFNKAKLDSLISTIEVNNKGMGSISVFRNGQEVYQRGYGYADVENKRKANALTRYRIGSISKTFTATLIMQLIEEGKISLSATLNDFYPQVKGSEKITIAHMLQHRSGIPDYLNVPNYFEWYTQPHTKEELLQRVLLRENKFEPDTKYEYSNSNYILLTFITEDASGKTYENLLQERIIQPCKLKNTSIGKKINPQQNEAFSYNMLTDWVKEKETDMSIPSGAGALVSTTTDINTFLTALFTGKLLKPNSLEQMLNMKDGYGFGLFKVPFYEHKGYGHNGKIDAFYSNAYYFPIENISVTILSNGVIYPLNDIVIGALSAAYGKDFQIPVFITLKEEDLQQYLGIYSTPTFPLKYAGEHKFRFEQAKLELQFIPHENKMILKQFGMTHEMQKE